MKREIHAPTIIEDGVHKGVIIAVEERTKPYKYVDVVLEFEEGKKIKAGYADWVSTTSKLGNLLARFGVDISTPGVFVDTDILIGKKCTFLTVKKDKYSDVVPESLKPCK